MAITQSSSVKLTVESVVRGYHVFKEVWDQRQGFIQKMSQEGANQAMSVSNTDGWKSFNPSTLCPIMTTSVSMFSGLWSHTDMI